MRLSAQYPSRWPYHCLPLLALAFAHESGNDFLKGVA